MLQFITHANSRFDTLQGAEQALKGGCRWIQLRMKDAPHGEILKTAIMLKKLCWDYQATFIIDDHVDICLQADLDGVHLGKTDMDPAEARRLLGEHKIIGGTANTFDDILRLADKGVDYIGLGPFRFTQTKKNLSPILGLEGYHTIFDLCRTHQIEIPVIAIGGITKNDIPALLQTGVSGIALSSTILEAEAPIQETQEIINLLNL
ncbi:MAG: thiamine phosphate synthase [Bacteroidales bacterium]